MSSTTRSGIRTSADGNSYIPSSTRADGSTRKAIKVRPGYRPPEDVDTYKSQNAEAWRNRGSVGIPGANTLEQSNDAAAAGKGKNAKRREAARKKKEAEADSERSTQEFAPDGVVNGLGSLELQSQTETKTETAQTEEDDSERQRKIRNLLKKLRGVHELRDKKAAGEKLSHEQLVKIGKEAELLRDLQKLNFDTSQLDET